MNGALRCYFPLAAGLETVQQSFHTTISNKTYALIQLSVFYFAFPSQIGIITVVFLWTVARLIAAATLLTLTGCLFLFEE